jgi:hypothetical protein
MNKTVVGCFATLIVLALAGWQPMQAQDMQQKLAAAKEAAARNQQALKSYSWVEKTDMLYKGEVKSTKVESCKYGPDGRVQKVVVQAPPPPAKKGGLRGKKIAEKEDEIKGQLEGAAALIQQYVPPDAAKMQAVIAAGTAALAQGGPAVVALKFANYVQPGDALTLVFESAVKSLQQIQVATYLTEPSTVVTLQVTMQPIGGGLSAPGTIDLTIPSSNIEVKVAKSNYQKLAQ